MLLAAAVAVPVQLPAECGADALSPKVPGGFGDAVEQAFAKTRASAPEGAAAEAAGALGLWAAGLKLQNGLVPPVPAQEDGILAQGAPEATARAALQGITPPISPEVAVAADVPPALHRVAAAGKPDTAEKPSAGTKFRPTFKKDAKPERAQNGADTASPFAPAQAVSPDVPPAPPAQSVEEAPQRAARGAEQSAALPASGAAFDRPAARMAAAGFPSGAVVSAGKAGENSEAADTRAAGRPFTGKAETFPDEAPKLSLPAGPEAPQVPLPAFGTEEHRKAEAPAGLKMPAGAKLDTETQTGAGLRMSARTQSPFAAKPPVQAEAAVKAMDTVRAEIPDAAEASSRTENPAGTSSTDGIAFRGAAAPGNAALARTAAQETASPRRNAGERLLRPDANAGGAAAPAVSRGAESADRAQRTPAQVPAQRDAGKANPAFPARLKGQESPAGAEPRDEGSASQASEFPDVRGALPSEGVHAAPDAMRAETPAPASQPVWNAEPNAAMQLARASSLAFSRGESRFRLKLRPEGLGEVAVSISARDKGLHLSIRAASEATRSLIVDQMGALKDELASGGYHLEGFSVDVSGQGRGGEPFSAFQQESGRRPPERQLDAKPGASPDPQPQRHPALEKRAGGISYRI